MTMTLTRPAPAQSTGETTWVVVDADGTILPGEWPTMDRAIDDGLVGTYQGDPRLTVTQDT